jgi:hypothetical protein
MPDIDAIERLLCQRYNVQALDAGELSTALALARGGDTQALREALDAREFYRWTNPIYEALNTADVEPEPETLEPMTIAELRTLADERGIDLGDARRKADIIAAIELAEESPVEPTTLKEEADSNVGDAG